MKQFQWCGLLAAAALMATTARGDQISDPVGYVKVEVPGNSDAIIPVPFHQDALFTGTVTAISGVTVSVAGAPFTPGQFNNGLYYIRLFSGTKNGLWSTVTNNTASSFDLVNASVAAGVAVGNTFGIYPHHTLNTAFPLSLLNISYLPSASAGSRKTEVRFRNQTAVGINKSSVATYFYLSSGTNVGWRLVGGGVFTDVGNTVIPPDTHLLIRNNQNTNALPFIAQGGVELGTLGTTLTAHTVPNDVYCVSGRPVPMSLDQLNLAGTPAWSSGTSAANRRDELRVFNNAAPGQNKSSSATYWHISSGTNVGWRLVGGSIFTDVGNLPVIEPGAGFIIRKATNSTPVSADWQAPAPY